MACFIQELLVTGIFLLFPKAAQVHTSQVCKGTTERKLPEQTILKHSLLYCPTCQNASVKDSYVKKKEGPTKKQQVRKAKEYTSSTALEMPWLPFIPLLWHCCT